MNQALIFAIVLSIISFIALYMIRKKYLGFSLTILVALGFGVILGSIFKENILFIENIGKIYISLIKMIVIPLVMVSLIRSIINLNDTDKLKRIGLKAIFFLLLTTAIATTLGIIIGSLFNVGQGISFAGAEDFVAKEVPSFSQVLLDMFPTNPIADMANGKVIPVIIFSLFVAVAVLIEEKKENNKVEVFKDFINALDGIFINITRMILKLTPYGVFALIATAAAKNGVSTLMSLLNVILAVYLACAIQILFVHTSLITLVTKKNPFKFLKAIFPAQVVAFTTQSSYGTLPVTIKSLVENAKVSESVASFVASLGSTIGMNGCGGVYPAIVVIFVSNMFNIELTLTQYVLLVITTIISSIGIAGVPGAATMSTTVVLTTLGLPIEGMAMVLGVDAVIDMVRTMTNVTGSATVAYIVDNSKK